MPASVTADTAQDPDPAAHDPILREGDTCLTVARARRAAMLVDGAAYFRAVRAAILGAERMVLIAGWDIDSRMRLAGEDGDVGPDAPATLREFLCHVVAQRPRLRICILLWDFTVLFAADREPLPTVSLGWSTPDRVDLALDDELPGEASHHEKIVVVDDHVAFCGGIDLTDRRWDTPRHNLGDPERVDAAGAAYEPFHDLALMVEGDAARALGDVFRDRWQNVRGERLAAVSGSIEAWPAFVEADIEDVPVGIARTRAAWGQSAGVKEIERLYLRSLAAARRLIYVENQFLTAGSFAVALCRQLGSEPDLEALLVTSRRGHEWLEEQAMGAARSRFLSYLAQEAPSERVRCLYACLPADGARRPLKLHSKAMFVDDRFAHFGSSNISNRSMGLDTECDVAIEAETQEHRAAIARMRNRLLAEHLGQTVEAVAVELEPGSACAYVDSRMNRDRTLLPLERGDVEPLSEALAPIADPEGPFGAPGVAGTAPPSGRRAERRRGIRIAAAAVAAILVIVLVWRYTPLSELADVEAVTPWFEALRESAWAPAIVPAVYALASLCVFPVTVLIAVTGAVFGPLLGFVYSVAGCLAGAAATFLVGVVFGRLMLIERLGVRVSKVVRFFRDRGVVSVALIRLVPVAPFSVVNVVAGAARVRFRDFMLGTALGMVPGIALMTLLGDRLRRLWEEPDAGNIALLAGLVAVWIGVTFLAQRLVARWRRTRA